MSLVDTLAGFFDDPDDWPYVIGYQEYGIVSAHVDPPPQHDYEVVRKRIVISLESSQLFSIIQTRFMKDKKHWECADLSLEYLDPTVFLSTHDLFESFRR
jgi:hypothetical protein